MHHWQASRRAVPCSSEFFLSEDALGQWRGETARARMSRPRRRPRLVCTNMAARASESDGESSSAPGSDAETDEVQNHAMVKAAQKQFSNWNAALGGCFSISTTEKTARALNVTLAMYVYLHNRNTSIQFYWILWKLLQIATHSFTSIVNKSTQETCAKKTRLRVQPRSASVQWAGEVPQT